MHVDHNHDKSIYCQLLGSADGQSDNSLFSKSVWYQYMYMYNALLAIVVLVTAEYLAYEYKGARYIFSLDHVGSTFCLISLW